MFEPLVSISRATGGRALRAAFVAVIVTTVPAAAQTDDSVVADTSVPSTDATLEDPFATTSIPFADSFEGGNSGYGGQAAFDVASTAVLPDLLAAEQARLADLLTQSAEVAIESTTHSAEVVRLEAEMADRGERSAASVDAAATARREATDAAVEAYVNGDETAQLSSTMSDPVTFSRARTYLGAMSAKRLDMSLAYQDLAKQLDGEQVVLAESLAAARAAVDRTAESALVVETQIGYAQQNIDALERGSHVVVDGLVFPVAGMAHFIDSWGFPRLTGTVQQHWHEGIDIMAPTGRELVATEAGVINKVGTAGLGGARLWLMGDSGTDYYYAHLSGYAEGIADGVRVQAGQIVGYVGDTGGAAGGPPHLHMQIHPGGGDPVNPFPVLAAAWGDLEVPSQQDALAGEATVLAGSSDDFSVAHRPLVPWLVSPTDEVRSRLMAWMSLPR